jgi:hypothetical protein
MTRNIRQHGSLITAIIAVAILAAATQQATAVLYLYEPFNYTPGASLGGSGGVPIGQTGTYAGGGSYTWYARGTGGGSTHDPAKDAVISPGSLSYVGLAPSQGNSVGYGSGLPNYEIVDNQMVVIPENDAFNKSLYGDTVALPVPVSSGSLYASFIIRVKSEVEDGTAVADRHSPVGLVRDTSTLAQAGTGIANVQSGTATQMAGFWMRRDPDDVTLGTTNFSPGKSSSDGIGDAASGPSTGWQRTGGPGAESNQFGDVNGQPEALLANSATWQTYFVVLKYEFDAPTNDTDDVDPTDSDPVGNGQNDTVSLWMNPGAGTLGVANGEALASQAPSGNLGSYYASLDAYGTATTDIPSTIESFALLGHRQNTNNTFAMDIDELRIGTTWADVTPTTAPDQTGDHNGDGSVNAADYVAWRKLDGANEDGYDDFVRHFGEPLPSGGSGPVPEPSALVLLAMCVPALLTRRANR